MITVDIHSTDGTYPPSIDDSELADDDRAALLWIASAGDAGPRVRDALDYLPVQFYDQADGVYDDDDTIVSALRAYRIDAGIPVSDAEPDDWNTARAILLWIAACDYRDYCRET